MRHQPIVISLFLSCIFIPAAARAQTAPVKPPPPELQAAVDQLGKDIDQLRITLKDKPELLRLLPDIQIYYNAARYPLVYGDSYDAGKAKAAVAAGEDRAKLLAQGQTPWQYKPGIRGYLSKVDNSVQPYGFAPPKNLKASDTTKYRVDFFHHGRDESLTELHFIEQGVGGPADRFTVHPYGRCCLASKFAGEIDQLEIIDSLKAQYPIDESRLVLTGFSMGGGSSWHMAVHYSDLWVAASPGAGFAETREFQKISDKDLAKFPWYEQKLWNLYDCPGYAINLAQLPTISYAGELDGQKQAGDVMERAMKSEGMTLERIWGPNFGHGYESTSKKKLDARLDELAAPGRNAAPAKLRFATYTLRYNRMDYLTVDALEKHWSQARFESEIAADTLAAKTQNVAAFTLQFDPAHLPPGVDDKLAFKIDDQAMDSHPTPAGKTLAISFLKTEGKWHLAPSRDLVSEAGTRDGDPIPKRHNLQGPIDDAFMDSFLMVKPTGKPLNEAVGKWVDTESTRAILDWRKTFRGEAPVKNDADITEADIAHSNLILWGDPSSNAVLAKIAGKLPIQWTAAGIHLGKSDFAADHNAVILIYPNPLNPAHYVVLNSGMTFRESSTISNALQNPRLPDYAIVDLTTPPDKHSPGKIAAAGFFDEHWQLQENEGR